MNAPNNQDILRALILVVRHFQGEDGKLRMSLEKIDEYVREFGNDHFALASTVDEETKEIVLSLDRQQAPSTPRRQTK